MSRFDVKQFGDVAIVLHVDEESEDYFGHPIHAQYMTTATWRLGPDGWKMIASQVYASLVDPPAIDLPAGQLDDYVGTYRLTDDIRYAIRRDGDHLVGERTGRPPQTLRVEARDVLFVPGQPRSRKVFLRDAAGRVTRFADRREGRDIVWTRVASQATVLPNVHRDNANDRSCRGSPAIIHMRVNGMLRSVPRLQEAVLYDLLRRHYDGPLARRRQLARAS
jgi:hypothetical protein